MKFDETDLKLMALLQEDCKKTTKQYAHHLQLSVTAVYERIRRLEKTGVITKYVALLDKKKVGRSFIAYCHVKLVQHLKEYVEQFERDALQLEEITECYHVSGDYDYILKVHVADMDAYRDFVVTKLTALRNVGSSQSSFVISEVGHTTALPLKENGLP